MTAIEPAIAYPPKTAPIDTTKPTTNTTSALAHVTRDTSVPTTTMTTPSTSVTR